MRNSLLILGSDGVQSRMVYHALKREFPDAIMVTEASYGQWTFIERRMRRLGIVTTFGQIMFMVLIVPVLYRMDAKRIEQIKSQNGLDDSPLGESMYSVRSMNSVEAHQIFREIQPAVVVLAGTGILSKQTLSVLQSAIVLNMHAGITPLYRGVHGAYWARVEGKEELLGTTVHVVDAGIDTGAIIEYSFFAAEPSDSFVTYPFLHTTAGLPALTRAIRAALSGTLCPMDNPLGLRSVLRSHPTFWQYLGTRFRPSAWNRVK